MEIFLEGFFEVLLTTYFGLLAQNRRLTKDGLQGLNAELVLKNIALKVQSHTAGFLSDKSFQNGLCGFMHMDNKTG